MKKLALAAILFASIFNMGMSVPQQPQQATIILEDEGEGDQLIATAAAATNLPSDLQAQVEQAEATGIIPQEAVRLRIIANSDSEEDQKLKRDIRDEVLQAVAEEVRGITDPEEAREAIRQALPRFNEIAKQVIADKGYTYTVSTDFGLVPFPTKLYGDQVYPAGEYEALRIQVGAAQGQNWWCVLFPPLCFVDTANGDAVAKPMDGNQSAPITTVAIQSDNGQQEEVQVRSALLDKVTGWWDSLSDSIGSMFA